MRAAQEVENAAVNGNSIDYVERARIRGVDGFAARLLREAIDALMSIGGASGFADSSPLQRMWRDANIATRHVLLATDPSLEIYGRPSWSGGQHHTHNLEDYEGSLRVDHKQNSLTWLSSLGLKTK